MDEGVADDASWLGLLCNCSMKSDPKEQLSPSLINRIFLIGEQLSPAGIQVFVYSPRHVLPTGEATGYRVEGRDLLPDVQNVPRVNANWTYGTRRLINKGMGYRRFKRWARKNDIEIYVPYAFSELVSNKRKAFEVVAEYDAELHPHTEDFIGSTAQIASFFSRSGVVFIKPRAGNRGNRIFVLRRRTDGYSLKYYDSRSQRSLDRLTLSAALGVVEVATREKRYVIQEGVESLRFEGAVFDIRAVMVNDGKGWHSLLETRLAPRESDISNVYQGGSIQVTEDLLTALFGEREGLAVEEDVRRISHGLAEHLESMHPGALMELGFDFVLDESKGLHLVEINAKPGAAGFGSENKIFDWRPEDEPYYEKWVRPHARYLADFLRAKIEAG